MQPAMAMQQRAALPVMSRRTCVACRASTSSSKPSNSAWAGAKAAAAAAAAAACLLAAPVQPAAATTSLASLVPQDFSFVDANRDGVLSLVSACMASAHASRRRGRPASLDDAVDTTHAPIASMRWDSSRG